MRYLLGLAVAIAVGLSAASAQAQTPSPTVPASNTPVPAATATPTTVPAAPTIQAIPAPPSLVGDAPLDRVLPALAGTNVDEVSRQLFFLRLPCTGTTGSGAIPCPPGQPVGHYVDGMWVIGCQSVWVPAGSPAVTDAELAFLSSRQSLWAVTEAFLPNTAQFEAFYLPGSAALIEGHGVIAFQYPCGPTSMSDFMNAVAGTDARYVLAPGNPPFAPATGSGPALAGREDLRPWIAAIFLTGAAVVLAGAAFRHGRRWEH